MSNNILNFNKHCKHSEDENKKTTLINITDI
jgi:hypothetical protein